MSYEFTQEVRLNEIDRDNPEYTVTGLTDNVPYFFVVTAYDTEGTESGYSNEVNTKAPNITSFPTITQLSDITATIEWTTDMPSNSVVQYGTSPNEWGSYALNKIDNAMVTQHSVTLTGLDIDTRYYFQVGGSNELGFGPDSYPESVDNNPSPQDFFTTTEPDTTPPQILIQPYAAIITETYATIRWQTNESATSLVEYGKSSSYGQTDSDTGYHIDHNVIFNGLEPSTTYHFRVRCIDTTGLEENTVVSNNFTFTTAVTPDTIPPLITSPLTVTAITNTTATIEWENKRASHSRVQYGTTSGDIIGAIIPIR